MSQKAKELVRRAMVTVNQGLATECPFLTRSGTIGILSIHFRPQGDPRVTWERDFKISYIDNQIVTNNLFSRDFDSDNREMAMEVIEYTLFQYINPNRKVFSGKVEFMFNDGIITNISASGSLIYEDCSE
ncbi:hypothetical protein [Paenibacillus sp. IITD108]|uniref:hypothetical protein n=1 Tax=Paenibacillus sp. IITD108 TaxID=3116649 RepID=UPI002F415653